MNIKLKCSERTVRRFMNILVYFDFRSIDLQKFVDDNVVDDDLESALNKVLDMSRDEAHDLLSKYCQSDDKTRLKEQLQLMESSMFVCVPFEEEVHKPSPMYPIWRGHKVHNDSNRRY